MTGPSTVGRILGYCDHAGAVLSRNEANNGIGMYCDECRSWVTKFDRLWLGKDHPELVGKNIDEIPLVRRNIYRKCQGPCGALGYCEEHHVAPRAFFGDAAEDFPKLWLCRACHEWWHRVLTPGLCTTYDPTEHARMLLGYLGVDRAAQLTRVLIELGRAKRAGVA